MISLLCWQKVKQCNKCITVHGPCTHGLLLLILYFHIYREFDQGRFELGLDLALYFDAT